MVSTTRPVTRARSMAAMSASNQCTGPLDGAQTSADADASALGKGSSGGDWVGPPPGRPVKKRDREVGRAPAPSRLTATPETMWSTPKMTVARAWIARRRPREHCPEDARPRAVVIGEEGGAPGAEDHHPLETDVDHAGPLGPQTAEAGQGDRHGQPDGRGEGAGGVDVVGAGDDPQQR
jgi:hypothetical protein